MDCNSRVLGVYTELVYEYNYFEMKGAHLVKKDENKDKNDDGREA